MKLSTRARYGLHCMIAVSRRAGCERPVSLEEVASWTGLSKRYLEQLAASLRHAALLSSVSGRHGGYLLARPAETIHLSEIVEALIGPINIVDCVCDPENCFKAERCESRLVYLLVNRSITRVLSEYSLADLSNPERLSEMAEALDQPGGAADRPSLPAQDLCGCAAPSAEPRA